MSFAEFISDDGGSVAVHYSSVIMFRVLANGNTYIVMRAGNEVIDLEVRETFDAVLARLKEARKADINSFDPD